jgi:glycerol kinase
LYLCLDQGGHASRALLIDAAGNIHGQAFREIHTQRDANRVEHEPGEIIATLREAAEQVVSELGAEAGRITAAGFATQRSSIVCWRKSTGEALSPVLSWQDTRASDWLSNFSRQEKFVHDITGLMLSPHYGVSKMNWCLQHLDAVKAAQADNDLVIGPLASFIVRQLLTNQPDYADPANASRTLLWDRRTHDWSEELLDTFGIARALLPASVPSRHEWGMLEVGDRKIPVAVVTGDQSAALFAFGKPADSTVYANLGTGAFVQRSFSDQNVEPGRLLASVVFCDAEAQVSVLEGTVNGAGSAINALCEELGVDQAYMRANSAGWLTAYEDLPLFVNGVSGLGSPWWLAAVRSRFVGNGSTEQKIAAVTESIAFLIAVNLQAMSERAGEPERLIVTGGLGSVDPLLQRIANLTGLVVTRAQVTEATARGLAFLLAGQPDTWPSVRVDSEFQPHEDVALQTRFIRWSEEMPAIPA